MHNSLSACAKVRIPLEYISRDYNNTKKSHYPSSHNEKSYPKNLYYMHNYSISRNISIKITKLMLMLSS